MIHTLVALIAALGLPDIAGDAAAEKLLRVAPHADLKNLDPIWTTANITRNHGYMAYDTLIAMDGNLRPQPQMLEKWEISDDGLRYTFTLRDGLRWHDGAPVVAEDAVASIRRWGVRDGMGQKLMDFTDSLEATSEKVFVLTLKEPYGLVLDSFGKFSSNALFIMKKEMAETDAYEPVPEVIGSGPFIFDKDAWVPGSKVIYRKNPTYNPRPEPPDGLAGEKVVYFDTVEWIYIPDPTTTMNALVAGEIDYWEAPPVDLIPLVERHPEIAVQVIDPLGTQGWLRPNHLNPPFDNPKARQALLYMVKQADYLRAIFGDEKFWRECAAYFVCNTPLDTTIGADPLMNQDFEMAAKLLKEGGYNGETLILMQPTDIPELGAATQVTAELLRRIGARVEVQAMDWSRLISRRADKRPASEGGWNLFHTFTSGANAASPIANIGISGGCEEKGWFGWPCDRMIEDLRSEFSRAMGADKQLQIAKRLQKRLYEVVPYVSIGQWFQPIAVRNDLFPINAPAPVFWGMFPFQCATGTCQCNSGGCSKHCCDK